MLVLSNFHLEVSELLRSYIIRSLPFEGSCIHPLGSSRKQKRRSLLNMSLLRACSGIRAQTEEKYALPGRPVKFTKQKSSTTGRSVYRGGIARDAGGKELLPDVASVYCIVYCCELWF